MDADVHHFYSRIHTFAYAYIRVRDCFLIHPKPVDLNHNYLFTILHHL